MALNIYPKMGGRTDFVMHHKIGTPHIFEQVQI
jgi:hypothetical protein